MEVRKLLICHSLVGFGVLLACNYLLRFIGTLYPPCFGSASLIGEDEIQMGLCFSIVFTKLQ